MIRRGFTLLETVMAAAIGMIVVLTAVGVLSAINRADTSLAKRAYEVAQLEVVHSIMGRAFSTLAVSDSSPPRPTGPGFRRATDQASASSRASTTSTSREEATAEGRSDRPAPTSGNPTELSTSRDEDASGDAGAPTAASSPASVEPPRMLLGEDSREGVGPMTLQLTGDRGQMQSRPQRFELVLARPPVPYPPSASRVVSPPTEQTPGTPAPPTIKSFRGAFELIPEPARPGASVSGEPSYALWWRPLAPAGQSIATDEDQQSLVPPPVKIADRIAFARWEAYQNLKPSDTYRCTWAQDLPAYVTLEMQTVGGLYAKWMFEVDWVVQSELEKPDPKTGGPRQLRDLPVVPGRPAGAAPLEARPVGALRPDAGKGGDN